MATKMKVAVKNQSTCMPQDLVQKSGGTNCLVEFFGRRGGAYVRGRILEVKAVPESDYVVCWLVDEFRKEAVHRSQIFQTTQEILEFPSFVSPKK